MNKLSFKRVYLIYFCVLAALAAAACLYVNALLQDYEASQPEAYVRAVMEELVSDASEGRFWEKYSFPAAVPGRFEAHLDLKTEYLAAYTEGNLAISQKSAAEDELWYTVEKNGFPLAEVQLKAAGPMVTRLAVFSSREWEVVSVTPLMEPRTYTLTLPVGIRGSVNGIDLAKTAGGNSDVTYTIDGVYLPPRLELTDEAGNRGEYRFKGERILPVLYRYSLTLPSALTLTLNGEPRQGTAQGDDRVCHDIVRLAQPAIQISDAYGHVVDYAGGDELPLTYMTITADDRYTVKVDGEAVPAQAVTAEVDPDHVHFADYVPGLPKRTVYHIAILKQDADIAVTDENGAVVILQEGETVHDLTQEEGLDVIPAEIAAEVDVLDIAQKWSLFMSNDLRFSKVEPYLIAGSYQHEVAKKYATGVDITFTSSHTLANPAFTDNSVTNFVSVTDTCFSVDISFVKHMRLPSGRALDDAMNDRFYFVKYDDTDDQVDNPVWKLASMQEVVDDAET